MGHNGYETLIAGGGIMGLSLALEEAKRGKRVCVLEKGRFSYKASWAAAGILVTRGAQAFHSDFRRFYVRSIRLYPRWIAEIEALSGVRVPLYWKGDYVFFDRDEPASMQAAYTMRRRLEKEQALGVHISNRVPDFLKTLVRERAWEVFHFPAEGFVHNRLLLEALVAACRAQKVELLEDQEVQTVECAPEGCRVVSSGNLFRADTLVVSAGSWCNEILELAGWKAPVIPVKGQLALIPRMHQGDSIIHYNDELYLVPRGEHLVVGATTEARQWSEEFDDKGQSFLESRMVAFLEKPEFKPVETWTGLRPRSKDRKPLVGALNEGSLVLCTGHYKSGISMAPLTAQCLSQMISGETPREAIKSFDPLRKNGVQRT